MKNFLIFCFFLGLVISAEAQLSVPVQNSPNDSSINLATSIELSINAISSGTVAIEYSENANMTSSDRLEFYTSTSLTKAKLTKLKLSTKYYWRVKRYTWDKTDSSDWSGVFHFTTDSILHNFTEQNLNYLNSDGSSILMSTYTTENFNVYNFQIDTSLNFQSTSLREITLIDSNDTSFLTSVQTDFLFGTVYYLRFRARSSVDSTDWSRIRRFSFKDAVVTDRPNYQNRYGTTLDVYWNFGRPEDKYQLQFDTTINFASISIDTLVTVDYVANFLNPFSVNLLNFGEEYYYRIRAVNAVDTTIWAIDSFKTLDFESGYFGTEIRFGYFTNFPVVDFSVWDTISGTTGHIFEIDTAIDFTSTLKERLNLEQRDSSISNLLFDTRYYYRAKPYHPKDTGSWSKVYTSKVFDYPRLVYPDDNAQVIGVEDSVVFFGYKGVTAYQVQIGLNENFLDGVFLDTVILDTGEALSYHVSGGLLEYGQQYHWRVRALHSKDTSVWSPIRIFVTIGAPKVLVPNNGVKVDPTLFLQWSNVSNGVKYQLKVDSTSNFNSPYLLDTIRQGTSCSLNKLLFRPNYYWKVRTVSEKDTSNWSETATFSIKQARILSPFSNETNVSLRSVYWESIQGITGYSIELSSDSVFKNPIQIVENSTRDHHTFFDLPFGIEYGNKNFTRVKLFHSLDTSSWSDPVGFTLRARESPVKLYPEDGSVKINRIVNMIWESYEGYSSYELYYGQDSSFVVFNSVEVSDTSINLILEANTSYYWKVRAQNINGNPRNDWSTTWRFETNDSVSPPILLFPTNSSVNVVLDITLTWKTAENVSEFEIELSEDSLFTNPRSRVVFSDKTGFSNLLDETTYFWRVRFRSEQFVGPWSEVWNFTTGKDLINIVPLKPVEISLYPNPTGRVLNISSDEKIELIEIFDNVGKTVYQEKINFQNQILLDTKNLVDGVYFIKIMYDNGVKTQKFVKYSLD